MLFKSYRDVALFLCNIDVAIDNIQPLPKNPSQTHLGSIIQYFPLLSKKLHQFDGAFFILDVVLAVQ
jgi:hypothetical protein